MRAVSVGLLVTFEMCVVKEPPVLCQAFREIQVCRFKRHYGQIRRLLLLIGKCPNPRNDGCSFKRRWCKMFYQQCQTVGFRTLR